MATQQQTTYTIPIAPGSHAYFTLTWPVTEAEWAQVMAVLEAMKPGLVVEHAEVPKETRHPVTEVGRGDWGNDATAGGDAAPYASAAGGGTAS